MVHARKLAAVPRGRRSQGVGKSDNGKTLHRRGEWNVVMVGGSHRKSGKTEPVSSLSRGSIKLGSLLRVFPTALPTFQALISSAG